MLHERFMRMPNVAGQVGLCSGQIYNLIREGQFPAPIKLGRASVWLATEVSAWMAERVIATRG